MKYKMTNNQQKTEINKEFLKECDSSSPINSKKKKKAVEGQPQRTNVPILDIAIYWAKKQDDGKINWFNEYVPHCVACKWRCPLVMNSMIARGMNLTRLNSKIEKMLDEVISVQNFWKSSSGLLERAHLINHSVGGECKPNNLVPLCKRCHSLMTKTTFTTKEEAIRWIQNQPLCNINFQQYTDYTACTGEDEPLYRTRDCRFNAEYERIHSIQMKLENWKLVWKTPEGQYIETVEEMKEYERQKLEKDDSEEES